MADDRQDMGNAEGRHCPSHGGNDGRMAVDGVASDVRRHAGSVRTSKSLDGRASDGGGNRIVVPPMGEPSSGRRVGGVSSSHASNGVRARGVPAGGGSRVAAASGVRDGVRAASRGMASRASDGGTRGDARRRVRHDARDAERQGVGDGTAGRRSCGGGTMVTSPAASSGRVGVARTAVGRQSGRGVGPDGARAYDATRNAVTGVLSRSEGVVAGDAVGGGHHAGNGVIGRVSGSRAASGVMGDAVGDRPASGSSDGRGSGDSVRGVVVSASSDDVHGDVDVGTGGFTEEERRLYEEAHAPLVDRVRGAFAESSVPIACVAIIGIAVALRFLMSFSSVVLTVLAVGIGVILMGSIVYVTYEDQRKANALADEAEMLYAEKCRIEERAARDNGDAADGGAKSER